MQSKSDKKLFIGIMSGTSSDGLDVALCSINDNQIIIIDSISQKYSKKLQMEIIELNSPSFDDLNKSNILGNKIAKISIKLIDQILLNNQIKPSSIEAIGFHGPTIRHVPKNFYSLQIGNEFLLANRTQIKTVSNFRNMDIAANGEGAPLIPLFHKYLLNTKNIKKGVIVNIGGFSNISIVNNNSIKGYDLGPGNVFMDFWINKIKNKKYDKNGSWAKSGTVLDDLLKRLLNDIFFKKKPPKSTGRDYFNLKWLTKFQLNEFKPEDVQRTFLELTAVLILREVEKLTGYKDVYICGGGANNNLLLDQLSKRCQKNVYTTEYLGIKPELIEPAGFAWLGCQSINNNRLNYQAITGAKKDNILGVVVHP
jgi:anhydro-N-acetylmuramic acid kinase